MPCRSTGQKAVPSTNTTSSGAVIAFTALRRQRTGATPKRVEDAERESAKQHVAAASAAKTSLRLDDVAGRYWQEVGQHHAGADNTWRQISFLMDFFGKDKLMTEITDDDVTKLVAWRRGHKPQRRADLALYRQRHHRAAEEAIHPRQGLECAL